MVNDTGKFLTISSWNINGLESKTNGVKSNKIYDPEVINSLNKFDLIGLMETHAGTETDISLQGYYVFRKDRPKHKKAWKSSGGIAVLVKESLRNACKFDPLSDSDVIWVRVQKQITKLSSDLFIAFVYLPPSNSSYGKVHGNEIMQKLEKHIEYFSCKGKIVICGDFNARVGTSSDFVSKEEEPHIPMPHDDLYEFILPRASFDRKNVNQYGKWLVDLCIDNQLYILNGRTLGDFCGKFTCHTPRGSSVIDYLISSYSLSYEILSMTVNDITLFSDHCLISLKLKISLDNDIDRSFCEDLPSLKYTHLPDKFSWSDEAKDKYQEAFHSSDIQQKLINIDKQLKGGCMDVKYMIDEITDVIVLAGNKSLFRKSFKPTKSKIKKVNKKWYDKDCRSLLKELKSVKNLFNRNISNDEVRIRYFRKFREYKKLIKYKRRKYKEHLTEILSKTMETDPQAAWKVIHELKNESLPSDKAEKINRTQWYSHFRDLLKSDNSEMDNKRQHQIKNELQDFENAEQLGNLDYDITENEIMNACKKLKNNKSSAYDMIKNEMLKSALPVISKTVVKIFNVLLKTGQFPNSWTEGIIIPIHKQGNSADPNNYRGITLSSCLGKLFCHVLNERISNFLEDKSFIGREQAGFRKNHRTSDQIFILKTIIDKYIHKNGKGNKLYACFIDFRKAFDTVCHTGLLLKLQRAGINGKIYELIKSMYQNSSSRVKCKNTLTDNIDIKQGVHQGSVLSPLLFNIFINDIGNTLLADDAPILYDSKVNHLLYADDLVLMSTTEEGLQRNIDKLHEYCTKWGLTINTNKSKVMTFSKTGRMVKDQFRFVIGKDDIEYVNQYKYLGVIFTSNAKFSIAEKTLSMKASRALFSIKQSIFDKTIKPSSILHIFDSLVKPIALYNSEIWSGYKYCFKGKTIEELFALTLKNTNEFDKTYMRFCKYVLGVNSKACNFAVISELGQFPLIISIITNCINFWLHTIQSNSDSLLQKAYQEQVNSSNNNNNMWLQFVKSLLYDLGFSHVWNNHSTFNTSALLFSVKNKLKERFIAFWKKRLSSEEGMKKLRTYKLIKQTFGIEPYLEHLVDKDLRRCLCSFRISTHKLRIERGRYYGERPEERLCDSCNIIENEIHFLCKCNKYNSLRKKMFDSINAIDVVHDSDNEHTFINLMTSSDKNITKALATFVQDCEIT